MTCAECPYLKILCMPLRSGGLCELGQARCEKYDLITDFRTKSKFDDMKCVKESEEE